MQDVKVRFAYKAGFRRLWIVTSVIWAVTVLFLTTRFSSVEWADVALLIAAPISGFYLLGAALVWVIEGFARADQ